MNVHGHVLCFCKIFISLVQVTGISILSVCVCKVLVTPTKLVAITADSCCEEW